MAEVHWIKIVTGIFDDEKIQLIDSMPDADAILVIWFKILCLAGKSNRNGLLMMNDRIAYTDGMLASLFRRKESTVKLALATFERFGMIEIVDNVIAISNWEKHQNIEGLDRIREQNRIRKQRQRAKELPMSRDSHVTVTQCHATDIDIEGDKDTEVSLKETKAKKSKFVPPAVEDVAAYCSERGNGIDAQEFVAYYASKGWTVGKNSPMKDWKSAVITWERNRKNKPKKGPNGVELTDDYNGDLDDIF